MDLGAIEATFDGTFDLNLDSVEHFSGTAHLQCHLRFLLVVLDVRGVAARDRWPLILRRTRFIIARLPVGWFRTGTHRLGSFHFVLLRHDLLALDATLLVTTAAVPGGEEKLFNRQFKEWTINHSLGTLSPLGHLPAHRTVQHVAVLPVTRNRLRTHAVRHDHGVLPSPGHFVDALHLARLYPNAAGLAARRKVRDIPSRGTLVVVAGSNPRLWFRLLGAQEGRDHFSRIIAHTIDYQLFDAAQARGTAAGVALFVPGVSLPRHRSLHFEIVRRIAVRRVSGKTGIVAVRHGAGFQVALLHLV